VQGIFVSDPTEVSREELAERVRLLAAENERLRAASAETARAGAAVTDTVPVSTRPSRGGWRPVVAVLLIATATILSPVAVVTGWTRLQLTSEQAFLDTFGPLASDPQVQQYVADRVVTEINNAVDINAIATDLFQGIDSLDLSPRAKSAIQLLQQPAVQGVNSLIQSTVDRFVQSDAFEAVWRQALVSAHSSLQVIAGDALQDPNRALSIDESGQISIQLAPIIAAIKERLVARGLTLAQRIPAVDKSIVIAQTDAVPKIKAAYAAATLVGTWLPILVLGLFAAGVLTARRRRRTLIVAALCLAGVMALALLGIAVGHLVFVNTLAPATLSVGAADAIFSQALVFAQGTVVALLILGIVIAAIAWFGGPSGPATASRRALRDAAAGIRRAGEERGITTGTVGQWIGSHDTVIHAGIAVAAAAVLLVVRPLTATVIIWTTVVALLLLLAVLLVSRPPHPAHPA
jgi:hypothetical protein